MDIHFVCLSIYPFVCEGTWRGGYRRMYGHMEIGVEKINVHMR
jgi:hypothetical protein